MVKRLEDQPFVLLGINSDGSRSALRKAMKDEHITWPNIHDGSPGEGPIAKRWNVHGWPTIVLIDHAGIIRYRDPEGEALERAVDELLQKVPKRP